MELKEAIEKLKYDLEIGYGENSLVNRECLKTVLEELNNRISKDELKNILRMVQDYQLNYKDTVLFNIIMQEIFGETEWTNLENKE